MEDSENCLLLIQKLYQEGNINDDQRDALKGKWNPFQHQKARCPLLRSARFSKI